MKLDNLKSFPENRLKSLFGLEPDILAQVILKVLPALTQQREQRLRNSSDRKRRFITRDGRPPSMLPIHKLLMTLLYLRHNTSATVVGQMFGFSADSVEKNALPEVLSALKELFPASRWEAVKRHRKEKWNPDEVDKIIVDSFETPIPRPSLNDRQKRVYSGKKKRHTLKTQIITDQKGKILDVAGGHCGPKADVKIWNETKLPNELKDKPKLGDKAYLGARKPTLIPKKKPKGGELSETEKAENRLISQERIYVEHAIRKVKGFRVVRDEYRLAQGIFPTVVSVIVGLLQFSDLMN
jgi:DDE superfamily endonuclease